MYKSLLAASLLIAGLTAQAAPLKKPNIVMIFADDLGYSDIGVNGARYYDTPNIDALAQKGIRFAAAYANSPNCAPSRGAIYSGQYCGRTGMYNVGYAERGKAANRSLIPPANSGSLPLDKLTFADALNKQGYNCVQFGKWHLGYTKETVPPKRGFTARWTTGPHKGLFMSEIFIHPSRWAHFHYGPAFSKGKGEKDGVFHFIFGDMDDPRNNMKQDFMVTDETLIKKGTYLSEYMDERVPQMLSDLKGQGKPFLLMVNKYLVHGPINAPKNDIKPYLNKPTDGDDKNPVFAAMVKKLDDSVGVVMKSLKTLNLTDNTIVIFFSDNGGVGGYKRLGIDGAGEDTGNAPLKGGKTMLYEGGIRVPLIAYWKGKITPGQVCNEPVAGTDLYPTFLELAGTSKLDFEKQFNQVLDGSSIVPLFNDPTKQLDREYLAFHFPAYALGYFGKGKPRAYWRSTPMSVIRTREYKLVEHFVGEETPGDGMRLELYNIVNDIGETKDISKSNPEVTRALYHKLCNWRKETGAKVPVKKSFNSNSYVSGQEIIYGNLTSGLKSILSCPAGTDGVLVIENNAQKGSAENLKSSTILTSVNGESVGNIDDLKKLFNKSMGKSVKLGLLISGKKKTASFQIKKALKPHALKKSELNDFQPYKIYQE